MFVYNRIFKSIEIPGQLSIGHGIFPSNLRWMCKNPQAPLEDGLEVPQGGWG